MKKSILIGFLLIVGCYQALTKQQKAERLVQDYIQSKNQASAKNLKFTELDLQTNVIGIIENKRIYNSDNHPILIRTVYYKLNKDLTRIIFTYTN